MRQTSDADILRILGYLALGRRLKRLAEHLQADPARAQACMPLADLSDLVESPDRRLAGAW